MTTTAETGPAVQSVVRAFSLLELLAGRGGPVGVSELAEDSGLSLATVHRLLRTLVDLGYVRQERARTYALGAGFLRFGEPAAAGLARWCRPLLAELAAELGESVNLAALEGEHVVYVAHVPSPHFVRTFAEVGSRVPLHTTGVGKAILAELPEPRVRTLLGRTGMAAATAHTITDPTAMARELAAVRARGFATDEQEQEAGVRCVAVAVPGTGRLAVSMSGPVSRVGDDLVERAVPRLREVAARIAEELRGRPG